MQTPWLTAFLHDPHMIRPGGRVADAAVPLRQGREGESQGDRLRWPTTSLRVTRPRSRISRSPSRTPAISPSETRRIPTTWVPAGPMMTNKASPCLQCHAIGQFKPERRRGGRERARPAGVASRFQPGYLEAWIANPRRMLPYTAMPQNIAPHGDIQIPVPKTFENKPIDMVRAIRDTLLNYVNAVELQLAIECRPGGRLRPRPPERLPRLPATLLDS